MFSFFSTGKPVIRANEWGGKNCFQSSPPPSIRKYRRVSRGRARASGLNTVLDVVIPFNIHDILQSSLTALPAGLADRGREMDKTSSFPPLPSRPAPRLAAAHSYPTSSGFGHSRCFKPNLTVEEVGLQYVPPTPPSVTYISNRFDSCRYWYRYWLMRSSLCLQAIKQNNKEHYRRLLEMVTEKYSKNQPLPFNQTRPQKHGQYSLLSNLRGCIEDTVKKCFFNIFFLSFLHPVSLYVTSELLPHKKPLNPFPRRWDAQVIFTCMGCQSDVC